MALIQYLAIPIGYLLGTLPSAYIIGKYIGKTDMRSEGDGKISAAAVYRRHGKLPFLMVVVMDVGKGLIAVIIARLLTGYLIEGIQDIPVTAQTIVMVTGFAAIIGHVWSPFLKFRGGLGATVIYGTLGGIIFFQTFIAVIIGLISMTFFYKPTWNTVIIIITLCIILIIQNMIGTAIPYYVGLYPLLLLLVMYIKRYQIKKKGNNT